LKPEKTHGGVSILSGNDWYDDLTREHPLARIMKSGRNRLLVICTLTLVIVYAVFLMPLPFMSDLWEDHTLRHRMYWSVNRTVIGMHKDDITLMLGEPESGWHYSAFVYRIHPPESRYHWRSLVIVFNADGTARRTFRANPIHMLGG